MKKINLMLCAVFFATSLFSQTISDFENLLLAADTFWNGSDLTGGFASGNAYFVNDYNTSFSSWSGFTYSNKKNSTTAGYTNQYSAITASGYNTSSNYAIADEYGNAKIRLTGNAAGKLVKGFYVTNTTYAYLSMKNGDAFAKKFGGTNGTDPDWFKLRALGWRSGALKSQFVDFFLADFRSSDSTQDYIVRDWRWVDLQPLGDVDSILFQLTSSDTGSFGMNTPAYFAMDNFTTTDTAFAQPVANDDEITTTYLNDTLIDVLSNDVGLVANPITVELLGSPYIPGAIDTVINNRILYTPAIGIVATDTLVYRVCDDLQACDTAHVIVHVTIINSLDDVTEVETNIFPNPFSNLLIIHSTTALTEIKWYDVAGSLVKNIRGNGENHAELNTEELSRGIYFMKMNSAKGIVIMKVVKK